MKFAFFTNCISPHQVPLAKALIKRLGSENYRYVYTEELTAERMAMGWGDKNRDFWYLQGGDDCLVLHEVDILMSAQRTWKLFDKRSTAGKQTIYVSERWFKPPLGFIRIFVLSYLKMALHFLRCFKSSWIKYFPYGIHAARDMVRLVGFLSGDVRCLFATPKVAFESCPGGVIVPLKEAIKAGVLSAEEIAFGKKHGFVQIPREQWGKVEPRKVYAKMRMWGYFVAPTTSSRQLRVASFPVLRTRAHIGELRVGADAQDCQYGNKTTEHTEDTEKDCQDFRNHKIHKRHKKGADALDCQCGEKPQNTQKGATRETGLYAPEHEVLGNWELKTRNCREGAPRLRVLWVGRMLKLKRVDTLVKACASEALKDKVELHLYGHGPEEEALKALAKGAPIYFHDFVPVEQVRDLMRAHDVYVFSSNASDGWGAVVSEALEEGMQVFGTVEAGASATVLPSTHLFKAGDVKRLTELLTAELPKVAIGEWTAEKGAEYFIGD